MRFDVVIREEKRIPVLRVGPLVRESGDGPRIERNAEEWLSRFKRMAKIANAATAEVLKGARDVEGFAGVLRAKRREVPYTTLTMVLDEAASENGGSGDEKQEGGAE